MASETQHLPFGGAQSGLNPVEMMWNDLKRENQETDNSTFKISARSQTYNMTVR